MKKIFGSIVAAGLLFTVSSCQKDYTPFGAALPDGSQPVNTLQGFFKADLNGAPFEAEFQQGIIFHDEDTDIRMLTVSGIKYEYTRRPEDFQQITATVSYYEGPKVYTISYPAAVQYISSHKEMGAEIYTSTESSEEYYVQITADDGKWIKGRFYTKVQLALSPDIEIEINNGEFEVPRIDR